ncbi:DUF1549 domain-containing protein [Planctomicrobium piriforme]|uniref:DUF1549 domain-containing protein n=1 Tax=Planctomicrobium piriforme TaxID=1576369 RepID=A0A1I3KXP9_9PLAN|nr:DUF1549 domain-containing protein [Planctomicrobium piriforme]SFI77282.1 Protein of unknown function [Planctomicrobium piriforme]
MAFPWNWLVPAAVIVGVGLLTTAATRVPVPDAGAVLQAGVPNDLQPAVEAVNRELAVLREQSGIAAAAPADEFTIWRRLSLALHGTIPSLEEIRRFEADSAPDRLQRWTAAMLEDPRFNSYFAERLARACVGVEGGQFLIFRRDRFLDWFSEQLRTHVPYDQVVRDMVQGEGIWTGEGEVNFVTQGFNDGNLDENALTARTVRAFLGQRIDCAQCHDHPFDHWKQTDFEGLAAYYGQVSVAVLGGVVEKQGREFKVKDSQTLEDREVKPSVPFNPEWLGEGGSRREQLARWITHPENQRFEIATANRVWGLLFGRPFEMNRPVDDLPDPQTNERLRVLEVLGRDFREHGYDLRRLIQVIAATEAFHFDSRHPTDLAAETNETGTSEDSGQVDVLREAWAVFPLIRLRPEQVIGAMLQANSLRTVDQNSHLFTRARRFFRERDFVNEFGDLGVDELEGGAGTIPQALLRMNGDFAKETSEATPFSSSGRIAADAAGPEQIVETVFLVCLTRKPTPEESAHFLAWFENQKRSRPAVEDLYWTLFNSPEFSWNH